MVAADCARNHRIGDWPLIVLRMAQANPLRSACVEWIGIAQELLEAAHALVNGVQVRVPCSHYEMAAQLRAAISLRASCAN